MNITDDEILNIEFFHDNNNKYTVDELINYIINKEKTTEQINGLKSYIHQLFELKIKLTHKLFKNYSTVTDFARFLGWSTSLPNFKAVK